MCSISTEHYVFSLHELRKIEFHCSMFMCYMVWKQTKIQQVELQYAHEKYKWMQVLFQSVENHMSISDHLGMSHP